jgi:hypothetical protein
MILKVLKWIRDKIDQYERRDFKRIGNKLATKYVNMFRSVKKSKDKMDESIDFENEHLRQMASNKYVVLNEKVLSQDRRVLNLYLRNLLQLDQDVIENLGIEKDRYLVKTYVPKKELVNTVTVTDNEENLVKEISSPSTI